jgi:hypothetical protein
MFLSKKLNKMKKKVWIVPLILSVSIAFIALVFHYPVHIENALTLNPEPDFIIQVSWLRIIFEPVLGVLLYLNRSFYAIKELVNTLYWLALLFAFYTIIKCLIIKEKEKVKKFLLLQLANLFILAGICFAILVVIFFIPLHNDRIINKTSDWVLVGTHSHTEFSHDGLISQDGLLKWHMRNGFDAFFITDHNNHKQTLEFVNMRRNREKPGEPVVFCGEEFSGSNH